MAPEPPGDEQLILRSREGDEEAFAVLCSRYEGLLQARIRPWLSAPIRRKVSILDVLQETLLTAHRRLDDFEDRGEGAFGAWLARIAELKAREAVRRYAGAAKRNVGQEVTRGQRPETALVPGAGPSPSEQAIAGERQDQIHRAMERLPDDYRRVLTLIQLDHVSLDTAATLMSRSRQAVKKLYSRALARLADLVELTGKGEADD